MKTKKMFRYNKSAYGAAEVSSGRCEWRLKIVKQVISSIYIGVAIDHHNEEDCFWYSTAGGGGGGYIYCGYVYSTVSVLTFAVSFFYLILKKLRFSKMIFVVAGGWRPAYTE